MRLTGNGYYSRDCILRSHNRPAIRRSQEHIRSQHAVFGCSPSHQFLGAPHTHTLGPRRGLHRVRSSVSVCVCLICGDNCPRYQRPWHQRPAVCLAHGLPAATCGDIWKTFARAPLRRALDLRSEDWQCCYYSIQPAVCVCVSVEKFL